MTQIHSNRPPRGDRARLEVEGVGKTFGQVTALEDVSLTVRNHEVIGLVGENGAGKSTLLKILSGIHEPTTGQLRVAGRTQRIRSPQQAAEFGVAVVHQEQSLLPNLTVGENILMAARGGRSATDQLAGVRRGLYNWRRIHEQAETALKRVGSTIDPRTTVERLSFSDRQMVEIAKAVRTVDEADVPPLIILDEPTSVLDKAEVEVLAAEIERLRTIGSVIFVSHRLDEVLAFSDRIYVMRAGKVVAERHTEGIDEAELFQLMTRRESLQRHELRPPRSEVVLQVEALGRTGVFHDVNLTVRRGEVHALVGVKDSGREELSRAIFGGEPYDHGRIRIADAWTKIRSVRHAIRLGVAYLPAERKVESMIAGMSIEDNLALAHPGSSAKGPFVRPRERRRMAQKWIDRLDIRPPTPRANIAALSGGNQQKVMVGKWMASENLNLLILDHPTRGIDPGAREIVYRQIEQACAAGAGVLLLADTLEEALQTSHRITVMRDGLTTATFDLGEEVPELADLMEKMV